MGIFTMIRKAVEGVISEVTKQKTAVTNHAVDPINGFINQIAGGVWTGPNADEFVNQLKQVIADLTDVGSVFGSLFQGLGGAIGSIDSGDTKAAGIVGDLGNVFSKIF